MYAGGPPPMPGDAGRFAGSQGANTLPSGRAIVLQPRRVALCQSASISTVRSERTSLAWCTRSSSKASANRVAKAVGAHGGSLYSTSPKTCIREVIEQHPRL